MLPLARANPTHGPLNQQMPIIYRYDHLPSLVLVVPLLFLVQILLVALLQHGVLLAEVLQLEGEGHHAHEQLIVDLVLLVLGPQIFDVLQQLVFLNLDAHILQDCLQTQLGDHFPLGHCNVELLLQLHQLCPRIEFVERNMLCSVEGSILPHLFDRLFQHCSGVLQAYLIEGGQDIGVCEMFFAFDLDGCGVFHFRVDASLGSIIDPLAHEYLILFAEEVGALPLPLIVDPVPLEVISAALGEDAVAASLANVPHALVDIAVGVDHASLAVRLVVHPHAVVAVAPLIEHGASALLGVVFPVARILAAQLVLGVGNPEGALAVALVSAPPALVLVSVGVVLDAEPILFVVLPVADVLVRADPFIRLLRSVLVQRLFLNQGEATFTQ